MIINLESVFNVEGRTADFDYEIDMSGAELDGSFPFVKPVKVKGAVSNSTGIVEINADASYEITLPCTRCARAVTRQMNCEISHTLVRELENEKNDDYIVVENLEYDLDPLVREDILLSIPYVFLCEPDCKGLCPKCGKNLNDGACGCKAETGRGFEALRALLDDEQ